MQEAVLPERVQEALGELVGAAKEGLLALSVGVGLGVLTELMEEEVDDVGGPKGRWNPERTARREAPGGEARGRRGRGAAGTVRAVRGSGSARPGRVGADARRRVDPSVSAHAG